MRLLPLLAFASILAFAAPAAHAQVPELRPGKPLRGTLSPGDSVDRVGIGAYYTDELRFRGRAGQHVAVTLRSTAFDAYLRVGRRVDGRFAALATDDDRGGGHDARVVLALPADGEYRIVVTTAAPRQGGTYTLELAAAPGGAAAPGRTP
jgi:hypothetical protein